MRALLLLNAQRIAIRNDSIKLISYHPQLSGIEFSRLWRVRPGILHTKLWWCL